MPTYPLDKPAAPRPEAHIDPQRLAAFLQSQGLPCVPPLTVHQYPSGFSNLTYRITDAEARTWVLRAPPRWHNIPSAHDMGREYRILEGLRRVYPLVPRTVLYGTDPCVPGGSFYLMECLRGVILRADMERPAAPPPETMRAIGLGLVDNLIQLHALDLDAAGLADLGHPQGYVERQLRGWYRRYAAAHTEDAPDMEPIGRWLDDHRPVSPAATLIHNDYKHDNIVLDPADPTRILAVLDWEMATVGDPWMDLGTSLAYWICEDDPPIMHRLRHSPTFLPGNPSRREVVEYYARGSRREPSDIVFYFVFGHMKLATILQQLHLRWVQGLTAERRYARLHEEVDACVRVARQAMAHRRIDHLFPT